MITLHVTRSYGHEQSIEVWLALPFSLFRARLYPTQRGETQKGEENDMPVITRPTFKSLTKKPAVPTKSAKPAAKRPAAPMIKATRPAAVPRTAKKAPATKRR